ncbi:MAG: hypothetical protein ABSD77_08780 [Verrucomicrobiota bacterium]|jgi:hypothetical protein
MKVKLTAGSAMLPGYTRAVAEINYGFGRREQLWFDVSPSCGNDMATSGDAWLMALLPLAFEWGKPLKIFAPVDPLLLQNAEKIQEVWAGWFPPRKPVPIKAPVAASSPCGRKTGLFFTGGVDSFFSLLHFDETARSGSASSERPVDDLIFVWGFDIPLEHRAAFERKNVRLAEVASSLGKNVVTVVTNLRQTRLRRLDWGLRLHSVALGAVGLALGKRFRTILISSWGGNKNSGPWGSHPLADPLMSSSRTRFVYYGGSFDRFTKTKYISQSDIALKHLHVCWQKGSDTNCGQCEKCCRTWLSLDLLGVLDKAVSFPREYCSLDQLKILRFANPRARQLFAELRGPAAERGRQDVVQAIEACLAADG